MNPTPKKPKSRQRLRVLTSVWGVRLQTALAPGSEKKVAVGNEGAPKSLDEKIDLSPSIVMSDNSSDRPAITMSGTRFDSTCDDLTSCNDLTSSITVITKQRVNDTASIDLHDLFKSETGVDGIHRSTEWRPKGGDAVDLAAQKIGKSTFSSDCPQPDDLKAAKSVG